MIIKKYVGKTESEATEEAKRELGQNIVVMNVRPAKKSGFFSFFQAQKIEVTVALEEESEKPVRTYSPDKNARPVGRNSALSDSGQRDTIIASSNGSALKPAADVKDDNSAIEEKLDNLSNLLEKSFLKTEKEEPKTYEKAAAEPEEPVTKAAPSPDISELA
ncbi:hypothetical protein [Butyrivibrio sp. FCS014]|uniref:hypothetical protein n=1 Tax=Butyrivibrio sp. FCS014 TaxID=1408304 RepID=UPI0004646AE0|nr:hypothetical protein [Butyrivibrio sp. FCS014]